MAPRSVRIIRYFSVRLFFFFFIPIFVPKWELFHPQNSREKHTRFSPGKLFSPTIQFRHPFSPQLFYPHEVSIETEGENFCSGEPVSHVVTLFPLTCHFTVFPRITRFVVSKSNGVTHRDTRWLNRTDFAATFHSHSRLCSLLLVDPHPLSSSRSFFACQSLSTLFSSP